MSEYDITPLTRAHAEIANLKKRLSDLRVENGRLQKELHAYETRVRKLLKMLEEEESCTKL